MTLWSLLNGERVLGIKKRQNEEGRGKIRNMEAEIRKPAMQLRTEETRWIGTAELYVVEMRGEVIRIR